MVNADIYVGKNVTVEIWNAAETEQKVVTVAQKSCRQLKVLAPLFGVKFLGLGLALGKRSLLILLRASRAWMGLGRTKFRYGLPG